MYYHRSSRKKRGSFKIIFLILLVAAVGSTVYLSRDIKPQIEKVVKPIDNAKLTD